jgi:integrase/recombinase XerD
MYELVIKNYLSYLLTKGYDKQTSIFRANNIKKFLHHTQKDAYYITGSDIESYYKYLQQQRSLRTGNLFKPSTLYHRIRSIELFFEMLVDTGQLPRVPEVYIRYPKRVDNDYTREILSQEEIKGLYESADMKERVILHLSYGCGLRVSELTAVNKTDLYLKENMLIVPKGKFNKRRIVPLTDKAVKDIIDYLKKENDPSEILILNSTGTRMLEWSYNRILKQLFKRIGIEEERIGRLSVHSLRHSIATHLLENGMELEKVRDFLGHNQLETTEIYTHISQQRLIGLQDDT